MSITFTENFSDIADAIRELRGTSDTYTPGQMAAAIGQYKDPLYGTGLTLSVSPDQVWTSGTDNDVLAMVQAADDGLIDLTDFWSVGDIRSVYIPNFMYEYSSLTDTHNAQTVNIVLMHANPDKYTYVTPPASGRTKPFFIYGQQNCLYVAGGMDIYNSNSGSWNGCARRGWCNNTYRESVPAYLKTITKQVNVTTAQEYNSTTNQISQDYFFIPAVKEIFGGTATSAGESTKYSNLTEFNALEQWDWYMTHTNRKKRNSPDPSYGYDMSWWTRSPDCNSSTSYRYISSSDQSISYMAAAKNSHGLAPCGCI